MQGLARLPAKGLLPEHRFDPVQLVIIGDCREVHHLPRLLLQYMAGEVVLVQAVHDQHDGAPELVVEAAVEGVVVPLVRRLALGLRQGLLGLQRVVDEDQVGAASGQHTADRGGDARALCRRLEFGDCLVAGCETPREVALVTVLARIRSTEIGALRHSADAIRAWSRVIDDRREPPRVRLRRQA
jgi:hypothetical protein